MPEKMSNTRVSALKYRSEWTLPYEITRMIAREIKSPLDWISFSQATPRIDAILTGETFVFSKYKPSSSFVHLNIPSTARTKPIGYSRSQLLGKFNEFSRKLSDNLCSISKSGRPFPNIFVSHELETLKIKIQRVDGLLEKSYLSAKTWCFDVALMQMQMAEDHAAGIGITISTQAYLNAMYGFVNSTLASMQSAKHKNGSSGLPAIAHIQKISGIKIPTKFFLKYFAAGRLESCRYPAQRSHSEEAVEQSFDAKLHLFRSCDLQIPTEVFNEAIAYYTKKAADAAKRSSSGLDLFEFAMVLHVADIANIGVPIEACKAMINIHAQEASLAAKMGDYDCAKDRIERAWTYEAFSDLKLATDVFKVELDKRITEVFELFECHVDLEMRRQVSRSVVWFVELTRLNVPKETIHKLATSCVESSSRNYQLRWSFFMSSKKRKKLEYRKYQETIRTQGYAFLHQEAIKAPFRHRETPLDQWHYHE